MRAAEQQGPTSWDYRRHGPRKRRREWRRCSCGRRFVGHGKTCGAPECVRSARNGHPWCRKRDLLRAFGAKARCSHTQEAATRIWRQLCPLLDSTERHALGIAWSHFRIGEGAAELDHLVGGLVAGRRLASLAGDFVRPPARTRG